MKNPKTASRGRPRAFDRTAALEAAMEVFWQKGYTSTSMTDLCEAMGIGSPSLYAAFGSKEQLYAEAIRHYNETKGPILEEAIGSAPTARAGIEAFLRLSARWLVCPQHPLGCMVVLSSVASEGIAGLGGMVLDERKKAFEMIEARLLRGVRDGDLPADTEVKPLARFFHTLQQGMSIQARDGATAEQLEEMVAVAMETWPEQKMRARKGKGMA